MPEADFQACLRDALDSAECVRASDLAGYPREVPTAPVSRPGAPEAFDTFFRASRAPSKPWAFLVRHSRLANGKG